MAREWHHSIMLLWLNFYVSEMIFRVASGTERLYILVTNGHTFIDFIVKKNKNWMNDNDFVYDIQTIFINT